MVDSCIGGKSSINIGKYKNIVGNIYPPDEINIDIDLLDSLPATQIVDGLCEAVKICYASSPADLERYLVLSSSVEESKNHIQEIIELCLGAKKRFIEIDEFDQKERLLLNYGHTFGHALESSLDFGLSHGIAVGIGMCVAVEFSRQQSLLKEEGVSRSLNLENYTINLLSEVSGLSGLLRQVDFDILVDCFRNDKKHRPNCYRVILPAGDGCLTLNELARNKDVHEKLKSAYGDVMKKIVEQ